MLAKYELPLEPKYYRCRDHYSLSMHMTDNNQLEVLSKNLIVNHTLFRILFLVNRRMQTHLHTILRLGRNSYVILGNLTRCGLDLIEPLQESHSQVSSPSQRVLLSKTNTILMSVYSSMLVGSVADYVPWTTIEW